MKARIPPQKRLSRDTLQACAEYANSLQDANNVRIFKEVFWEQTDREMKQLGLNFADEKYEDIIGEWKKRNGL